MFSTTAEREAINICDESNIASGPGDENRREEGSDEVPAQLATSSKGQNHPVIVSTSNSKQTDNQQQVRMPNIKVFSGRQRSCFNLVDRKVLYSISGPVGHYFYFGSKGVNCKECMHI